MKDFSFKKSLFLLLSATFLCFFNFSEAETLNYFYRDLGPGDTGPDVRRLQEVLNENSFFVALSGPGSVGQETEFFGELTKLAVIRFQEANRLKILVPVNLLRGTGFVGPATREILNKDFSANDSANSAGSQSNSQNFSNSSGDLKIPSKISSISPSKGKNGTTITIKGENFQELNTVFTTYQTFYKVPSKDGKTITLSLDLDIFDTESEAFQSYILPSVKEAVERTEAELLSEEFKVDDKILRNIDFNNINFGILERGDELPLNIWVNGSNLYKFKIEG